MEKYNPNRLPERIDFHKATSEFPITRENKAKLQIAFSKMDKDRLKKTIKALKEMEYECLDGKARIEWEKVEKYIKDRKTLNKLPPDLRDDFKMAAWCKFCREFAEKYLYSLEKQKKI